MIEYGFWGENMGAYELYTVKKIDDEHDEIWNKLANNSLQFTPFHREIYLNAVGFHGIRFVVLKKTKVIAGLLLAMDKDEMQQVPPYAPYQGILFQETSNSYKNQQEQLEAITVLLEEIEKERKQFCFSNHFSVVDMRPCLWHHYHEPESGLYEIGVQYTAIKNLTESDIESDLSKGRKLDYKYSSDRYTLRYEKSKDFAAFFNLYKKTFERQDITLNSSDFNSVNNIIKVTQSDNGLLRYAVDTLGNKISAIYVLINKEYAYYLFGANDPEFRKLGGNTFLLINVIKELKEQGVKYFDFVGVNSPNRGDYKLSFGAELKPYYICKYNKK